MAEKILVVSRHFWPENYRINEICHYLSAKEYRIDILCGQPSQDNGEYYPGYGFHRVKREKKDRIQLYRTFDVKEGTKANIRIFLNYFTFPFASWFQIRRLVRNRYSAVFIYQTSPVFSCSAGIRIARKLRIPVYIYVADLWPQSLYPVIDVQSTLFRRILLGLSDHYYKKADKLLVPSVRMQSWLKERLGLSADHIPVVPFSPDPLFEQESADEAVLDRLASGFNLLIFDDFNERLSVVTLVQTAEIIRKWNLRRIRFVVTASGQRIAELRQKVSEQHLDDYFYFEGFIPGESLGKYIHIADVVLAVVDPEDVDEFTVPERLISYIAAGRPVLVSLSGEVKTLIRDAGCGISTEPFDAQAIAEGIRSMYAMTQEQRYFMGQKGLSYLKDHYNRAMNFDKIHKILLNQTDEEPENVPEIRPLWDD